MNLLVDIAYAFLDPRVRYAMSDAPLLDVRGLTVRFPTQDGDRAGRLRPLVHAAPRRDARDRRRVRLGQERLEPRDHGAAQPQAHRRSSGEVLLRGPRDPARCRRSELREIRGKDIAMIFQDPFACLHPMYRVGDQIAEAVTAHARRLERAARGTRGRAARRGRDPERARPRARLPAPVLGRHAPARDDRDGARQQPVGADRRRADDGARRDRAGADPRADRARQARVRHRRDPRSRTTSGSSPRPRTRCS